MNDKEPSPDGDLPPIEPEAQPAEIRTFDKTPTFTALNALRYQRQALIREIELQNPRLLCYVAHLSAQLDRSDALGFVDLLHNVPRGEPLDLLLHTPGGDVDATEKLITMLREKVGDSKLRVIVPDFAKSAGTLMALGADSIVMSDCSELGPIDPQVIVRDSNGQGTGHSIFNFLHAYEEAAGALRDNPQDPVAQAEFSRFDPTTVKKYEMVRERTRKFAEKLLIPRGLNHTKITSQLLDIRSYPSHGQMIGWEEAQNLGLVIEYKPMTDRTWRQYWALYCHLRLAIDSGQRIFESDYVSLIM
jgi:hypothetical protein